jgi:hypothetical protein
MKRERVDSREMTVEEKTAMEEVKYLMGFVNSGNYDKSAQDEFVRVVVGSGTAHSMKDRYILTAEESAILISALRKLTGKNMS